MTLSLCALAIACSHRVSLSVPSADTHLMTRCEAYYRLRPKTLRRTTTQYESGGGKIDDELFLADNTRVDVFEDLLPIVLPESATARAVLDADAFMTKRTLYGIAGGTSAITGLAFLLSEQEPLLTGGLLLGGLGFTIASAVYENRAGNARIRAARTLDRSLREKLRLQPTTVTDGCEDL